MKVELSEVLEEIGRIESGHRESAVENSDNLRYYDALYSIISAEAVTGVIEELRILFAEQDDSS